jgi:transposase
VAAPSKLQRPWGDRVKTDARDAELLARLLKLDEIVEVVVPSVEQEAARDLVRAREDVRGDLMRARHRLSKLLLRQGIVYTGGRPWTGIHDTWLRGQRFDQPSRQLAFEAAYETMLLTVQRGTGWTTRSPRWRSTASTPTWCAGSAVCAGSPP